MAASGANSQRGTRITEQSSVRFSKPVEALLDASGLQIEEYMQSSSIGKSFRVNLAKLDGYLRIEYVPCPMAYGQKTCSRMMVEFRAANPITRCIKIEAADEYLRRRGWKHVQHYRSGFSNPVDGNEMRFLPPISMNFIDEFGNSLEVGPNIRNECITVSKLFFHF